jgi:hypothetical protein
MRPVERSDFKDYTAHLFDVFKEMPVCEEIWEVNQDRKTARLIE